MGICEICVKLKFKPSSLLGLAVLAGLSACSTHPIHGQLQTENAQSFRFTADDKTLLLTPGVLTADIGEPPNTSGFLRLKNAQGEIEIKTRPENFELNHFSLDAGRDKLSADLKGVWRERTERLDTLRELEYCTAQGFCPRTESIVVCPSKDSKKDACKTVYDTRIRFALDCPGSQPVDKIYQSYVVSLELDFFKPGQPEQRLARYQGESPPRRRVAHRQVLGPCIVR